MLFKLYLLLNCIFLGIVPSLVLGLVPFPGSTLAFYSQPAFVTFVAFIGVFMSTITFLVRIPTKYIITPNSLHIVSTPLPPAWTFGCPRTLVQVFQFPEAESQEASLKAYRKLHPHPFSPTRFLLHDLAGGGVRDMKGASRITRCH